MSAELHIHVIEPPLDEGDVKTFLGRSLGSKYYHPRNLGSMRSLEISRKVADSPAVRVGDVSWLKAAITGDTEAFVPEAVGVIVAMIGEDFPVIDDVLIAGIRGAIEAGEAHPFYTVEHADAVVDFLEAQRGKRAFTVSW